MPIQAGDDPERVRDRLEEQRKAVLADAKEVADARLEYELIVRELNAAQQFTPVKPGPSRMKDVRARGKGLNGEIARDGGPRVSSTPSLASAGKPRYITPAKTLRAANAVVAGLANLTGDADRKSVV